MPGDNKLFGNGAHMDTKKRRMLRIGFIGIGAVCICVGILRGEYTVILQKAVKICLECIGI